MTKFDLLCHFANVTPDTDRVSLPRPPIEIVSSLSRPWLWLLTPLGLYRFDSWGVKRELHGLFLFHQAPQHAFMLGIEPLGQSWVSTLLEFAGVLCSQAVVALDQIQD